MFFTIVAFNFSSICYAQNYFHSIDGNNEIIVLNDDITDEVDESLIDDSGTIPFSTKPDNKVWTVSMPLANLRLTSPFGYRRDPLNKKNHRMHNGIDLRAKFESVMAMLPGTVIDSGYSKTGGFYVSISHGVCICTYMHLSKILVRNGNHVSAGEVIAISGASGTRCTGPHLHLSTRFYDGQNKGKYFNPMLLFKFIGDKLNLLQP